MKQSGRFNHETFTDDTIQAACINTALSRLAAYGVDVSGERQALQAMQDRLAVLTKKEKDYHLIQDFMFGIFKK